MNFSKRLFIILILLLTPVLAVAQVTTPRYLNFQSVVTDDSGNLVKDPFVDLEFKILDSKGDQLYSERQVQAQVVNGVVNVMIGEGSVPNSSPLAPTGGIPLEALDPNDGIHYLQVKIGSNQPQENLELISTPYSMWAERSLTVAPNSIGSEEIKNGSIKVEDLAPGIAFSNISGVIASAQIPATVATVDQLTAHLNSTTAHTAKNITVEGPFLSTTRTTVEDVLVALDRRVSAYYVNQNEFNDNEVVARTAAVTTEASTRSAADTAEASTRSAADTAEATARTTADSALSTSIGGVSSSLTAHLGTDIATAHPTGTLPTSRLSGQIATGQIANGAVTSGKLESNLLINGLRMHARLISGVCSSSSVSLLFTDFLVIDSSSCDGHLLLPRISSVGDGKVYVIKSVLGNGTYVEADPPDSFDSYPGGSSLFVVPGESKSIVGVDGVWYEI